MKRRDESIAKDKRHGYRSRYLLLVLAIVMAFSAGAAGTAFAAQEEPEQPADGRIVGGATRAGRQVFVCRGIEYQARRQDLLLRRLF